MHLVRNKLVDLLARAACKRCVLVPVQVASGRFGVTPQFLVNADQLEIKIAQGAKPGAPLPRTCLRSKSCVTFLVRPGRRRAEWRLLLQ